MESAHEFVTKYKYCILVLVWTITLASFTAACYWINKTDVVHVVEKKPVVQQFVESKICRTKIQEAKNVEKTKNNANKNTPNTNCNLQNNENHKTNEDSIPDNPPTNGEIEVNQGDQSVNNDTNMVENGVQIYKNGKLVIDPKDVKPKPGLKTLVSNCDVVGIYNEAVDYMKTKEPWDNKKVAIVKGGAAIGTFAAFLYSTPLAAVVMSVSSFLIYYMPRQN